MLEKLLTVNWKLLFLTSESMGLTQEFILWAETLSDHPKAKIKANMYNWRPFLSLFLFLTRKQPQAVHAFPLLFGSSIESLAGKMKE